MGTILYPAGLRLILQSEQSIKSQPNPDGSYRNGDFIYTKDNKKIVSPLPLKRTYPEFQLFTFGRGLNVSNLKEAFQPIRVQIRGKGFNLSKEYPDAKSGYKAYGKEVFNLLNPIF